MCIVQVKLLPRSALKQSTRNSIESKMPTFNRKHSNHVLVDNLLVSSMNMKRRHKKVINFTSTFRPLYNLSRIWGFASFSIGINSNGELQIMRIQLSDGLWFLITTFIFSLFAIKSACKSEYTEGNVSQKTWAMLVCARFLEIFASAYSIFVIFWNICNRSKLINMVNMYIRFDRKVFIWKIYVHCLNPFCYAEIRLANNFMCFSLQRYRNWRYFSTTNMNIDALGLYASLPCFRLAFFH